MATATRTKLCRYRLKNCQFMCALSLIGTCGADGGVGRQPRTACRHCEAQDNAGPQTQARRLHFGTLYYRIPAQGLLGSKHENDVETVEEGVIMIGPSKAGFAILVLAAGLLASAPALADGPRGHARAGVHRGGPGLAHGYGRHYGGRGPVR